MIHQVRPFCWGAKPSCPKGAEERSHGWSRDVRRQPQVVAEPVEEGCVARPAPAGAEEGSPLPSREGLGEGSSTPAGVGEF